MAIGVRNIRAQGASLEARGNQASLFSPRSAFWCLDCFPVGESSVALKMELRTDPHGVGVAQLLANLGVSAAS